MISFCPEANQSLRLYYSWFFQFQLSKIPLVIAKRKHIGLLACNVRDNLSSDTFGFRCTKKAINRFLYIFHLLFCLYWLHSQATVQRWHQGLKKSLVQNSERKNVPFFPNGSLRKPCHLAMPEAVLVIRSGTLGAKLLGQRMDSGGRGSASKEEMPSRQNNRFHQRCCMT